MKTTNDSTLSIRVSKKDIDKVVELARIGVMHAPLAEADGFTAREEQMHAIRDVANAVIAAKSFDSSMERISGVGMRMFNGVQVRTVQLDGETWWIYRDACKAADLTCSPKLQARASDRNLKKIKFMGNPYIVCNKEGLIEIFGKSRKPMAASFVSWIKTLD